MTDKFEAPVANSNSPIGASWRRHTTTPPTGEPDTPTIPIGRLFPVASTVVINRADTPPDFDHCDDFTTTPRNADSPATCWPTNCDPPPGRAWAVRSGSGEN